MTERTIVLVDRADRDLVAVFRSWPPRCTAHVDASNRRGQTDMRCRQAVMRGIPGAPTVVAVAGGRISAILVEQPLAERMFAQRCWTHGTAAAGEWAPEWEPFDAERHADLLLEGGA